MAVYDVWMELQQVSKQNDTSILFILTLSHTFSHYFTNSGTENISVFAWGFGDQLGFWFSTMGKLSSFINQELRPFLESNVPVRCIYIFKKLTSAVDVLIISLDMPRTIFKPTWNQQWKQGSWCFHTKFEHCHCLVFSTKTKQALKAKQHFKRHPGGVTYFYEIHFNKLLERSSQSRGKE